MGEGGIIIAVPEPQPRSNEHLNIKRMRRSGKNVRSKIDETNFYQDHSVTDLAMSIRRRYFGVRGMQRQVLAMDAKRCDASAEALPVPQMPA